MKVERTLTSEFVNGLKVAAYMEDVLSAFGKPVNRFSTHWSTPGSGAVNVRRLFEEKDVIALMERIAELEANINLKADFIENTMNDSAGDYQKITELNDKVETAEAKLACAISVFRPFGEMAVMDDNADDDDVCIMSAKTVKEARQFLREVDSEDTVKIAARTLLRALQRARIDMTILRLFLNGEPVTALRTLAGELT